MFPKFLLFDLFVTTAEGTIQRIYNAAGEVIQHINGDGETHDYAYDTVSRLIQTTDPESFVKAFAYDNRDNIATVTDGRGGLTTFAYDPLDRMTTRTNPLSETMTRSYDARDNLSTLIREDGVTEIATYDGLSRRTGVTTPDNALAYTYDPRGNLTAANDNDSGVSFTYDARNRLATTTTDGTVGPQPAVTLTYAYDALDRRLSVSDSLGGTTAYAWDVEDRLSDLTAPWGTVYTFGYDGEGRRTSLSSTTGRNSTMGYTNGLLSALSHVQSGVTLTDLAYEYDVDGQLTGIVDNLDPSKSKAIAYDNLNRLVQVADGVPVSQGGTPIPTEDYAYDGEGNRLASHLSTLYTSNAHNQLTEDDDYTYSYDTKGNRVSRTAKVDGAVETYTYDSQNRLVGYTDGTTVASYAYDAMERRVAKTVDGVVTAYIYDMSPDNALAHEDILMEFDTTGGSVAVKRRWLHSNSVDEPIGFEEYASTSSAGSGNERSLFADRQGSVIWVIDPVTSAVVAAYEYDGYGATTQTQGTLQQPYGYTGREFDTESGLYYYRARSYDPVAGMFVQSDPIGFRGRQTNLTTFVHNNPFSLSDPSGLTAMVKKGPFAARFSPILADMGALVSGVTRMAVGSAGKIGSGALDLANKISRAISAADIIVQSVGNDDGKTDEKECASPDDIPLGWEIDDGKVHGDLELPGLTGATEIANAISRLELSIRVRIAENMGFALTTGKDARWERHQIRIDREEKFLQELKDAQKRRGGDGC